MHNIKAEITLKLSLKDVGDKKEMEVLVDVEGADLEVMELAEIAQQLKLVGEGCMERILIRVLNEDPKLIGAIDNYLNVN